MTRRAAQSGTQHERIRAASLRRRDERKTALRQTILDAAGELFLEVGYDRFSMRQLAERIGYTATTIYRYFDNKDSLIFAVVDRGFERFGEALAAATSSTEDPLERIRALGRAYIRFATENPVYYELMFMQRTDYLMTPPDGRTEPRHATFLTLERAVEAAIAAGAVRAGDALEISHTLWALVHGIASIALTLGKHVGIEPTGTYESAIALFFDGVKAR